ncbi:MAG: hypothetical protein DRG78_09345 [Epsilonproteobacteria bacterium]|nr:MAG: hypothetical protein DRG78_09345 [Campylobacterota bacterium]
MLKRNEVRECYITFYETNDAAHQIDHADMVCDLMLEMKKSLKLNIADYLIYMAAYMHDMYSDLAGRKTHHQLAGTYILNTRDKCLDKLSNMDKVCVASAVMEHRGSYTGEFSYQLSELISSADRGYPDLELMIDRSLKYNKGNMNDVIIHIKDKFGEGGYAIYPDMYEKHFGEVLEKMRLDISFM